MVVQELGECLKIPFEGEEIISSNDDKLTNCVTKDFYYEISRISKKEFTLRINKSIGKAHEKPFWSAENIKIDDTMLHYFLCYILAPKFSNHATITDPKM